MIIQGAQDHSAAMSPYHAPKTHTFSTLDNPTFIRRIEPGTYAKERTLLGLISTFGNSAKTCIMNSFCFGFFHLKLQPRKYSCLLPHISVSQIRKQDTHSTQTIPKNRDTIARQCKVLHLELVNQRKECLAPNNRALAQTTSNLQYV
jgi:hypothetical protein